LLSIRILIEEIHVSKRPRCHISNLQNIWMMQENRETVSNTARMTEPQLKGRNVITLEGLEGDVAISFGGTGYCTICTCKVQYR
jgi:hypothetical protein